MAKANVFNMAGQQVGEIELSEAVFGVEPNQAVVHEVVKNHLAAKAASGDILVVDGLKLDEIKTKTMRDFLNAIEAGKSVVITPEVDQVVVKSARNIPGVVTTTAKVLSVYDIVNAKRLVVDKAALAIIEEVFA